MCREVQQNQLMFKTRSLRATRRLHKSHFRFPVSHYGGLLLSLNYRLYSYNSNNYSLIINSCSFTKFAFSIRKLLNICPLRRCSSVRVISNIVKLAMFCLSEEELSKCCILVQMFSIQIFSYIAIKHLN